MPEFQLDHGSPEAARQSPGQRAYEVDCQRKPCYHDGNTRRTWASLPEYAQWSWNRNPTPRDY